jgi:hypothetical protein
MVKKKTLNKLQMVKNIKKSEKGTHRGKGVRRSRSPIVTSSFVAEKASRMAATKSLTNLPLGLPCGLELKNRLIKSAMSEKMAKKGCPTADHARVYRRWAEGGWAALVTGQYRCRVGKVARKKTHY